MKAKAAVFMGAHKDLEVREFEVTPVPKGYGQMELIASGICGTELHFHNGNWTLLLRRLSVTNLWEKLPILMIKRER